MLASNKPTEVRSLPLSFDKFPVSWDALVLVWRHYDVQILHLQNQEKQLRLWIGDFLYDIVFFSAFMYKTIQ